MSTLASWTSIAYTSWYGCGNYYGDPYGADSAGNAGRLHSELGAFQGFQCVASTAKPAFTFVFFSSYIVITAWVIMSLFIGVISMGMFDAFENMKAVNSRLGYLKRLEANQDTADEKASATRRRMARSKKDDFSLKDRIDMALEDVHFSEEPSGDWDRRFREASARCVQVRDHWAFASLITATICLVAVMIGVDSDEAAHCARYDVRTRGREDPGESWCNDGAPVHSVVVGILAQVIFTVECGVKILAEGYAPARYFTDEENGAWNKFDFFIVAVG